MKKRICAILLVTVMTVSELMLLSLGANAAGKHSKEKLQEIDAMNDLLIGVNTSCIKNSKEVDDWWDEDVCNFVRMKLLWDYEEDSHLNKIGFETYYDVEGFVSFDYDLVQRVTQESLGREFPQSDSWDVKRSGDKVCVLPSDGDGAEIISVQDYVKEGTKVTAIGTIVKQHVIFCEFLGYFQAEFQLNPSGLYGYTLTSFCVIDGNQSFENLEATASSELSETGRILAAENVIDKNRTTAWSEAAPGIGVNEWICLETSDGSKMDLNAIEILTGNHKNQDDLQKNSAPKTVLIECDGGYKQEGYVNGENDAGIVILDEPQETSFVKISILEVYDGYEYEDTCISEIFLRGLDAEAYFEEFDDPAENPSHGESNVFLTIAVVALALAGIAIGAYGVVIFNKNNALYRK